MIVKGMCSKKLFFHVVESGQLWSLSTFFTPNSLKIDSILLCAVVKQYFFPGLITVKGIVISCFVTKSEKYKLFFSDFQNVEIIGF